MSNQETQKVNHMYENEILRENNDRLNTYIKDKINQLLVVMGTRPLDTEKLDRDTLLDLDPIGIIALSFEQVLDHLKETNRKLCIAKDQLQAVFDTAGVCISIVDPELRIVNCNEKQKELLVSGNKEGLKGSYCYEVYCGKDSPTLDCPAIETLETGRSVFIRDIKKRDKHLQIVTSPLNDADGNVTGVVEVSIDVTEKKKAEEGLRQAEKLAAIGLLAAGIAHEINNPLANILGYAKTLMKDQNMNDKHTENLEVIVEQANKASDIIRGILDFSRQSRPSFKEVEMNGIILKVIKTLSGQINKQKIKIVTNLGEIPAVKADPEQIEQVIDNLLLNAFYVFEGRRNGTIIVETERSGNFVEVRVIDNGDGIQEEILSSIFDPFFTTKPVGMGAGLGLSICSGIIRDHGGTIHVESEPGKGTKFSFNIPTLPA